MSCSTTCYNQKICIFKPIKFCCKVLPSSQFYHVFQSFLMVPNLTYYCFAACIIMWNSVNKINIQDNSSNKRIHHIGESTSHPCRLLFKATKHVSLFRFIQRFFICICLYILFQIFLPTLCITSSLQNLVSFGCARFSILCPAAFNKRQPIGNFTPFGSDSCYECRS